MADTETVRRALLTRLLTLYVTLAEVCENLPTPILLDSGQGLVMDEMDEMDAIKRVADLADEQAMPRERRAQLQRACNAWLAANELATTYCMVPVQRQAEAATICLGWCTADINALMQWLDSGQG